MRVRTPLGVARAEEPCSGLGEMSECSQFRYGPRCRTGAGWITEGVVKKDVDREGRAAAVLLLRNLLED
jgi:hypothetical protein